jgi:hypothetical protein
MLRHSVQDDRGTSTFFIAKSVNMSATPVRATTGVAELKSGWTELSSANWPSPVCPLEFGPNYGENRIIVDRIFELRLYMRFAWV